MVRYPSVCPIYRPLQQRAAGLLLLVIIVIQLLLGNRYRRRTLKGGQQKMRAVSHLQPPYKAEHRRVFNYIWHIRNKA